MYAEKDYRLLNVNVLTLFLLKGRLNKKNYQPHVAGSLPQIIDDFGYLVLRFLKGKLG